MTQLQHEHATRSLVPLIPSLSRRARRLARSPCDADDLVQETLLSMCQRLADGATIDNMPAYAMQALANQARKTWRIAAVDELQDDTALTAPDAEDRLACAEVLAAIARLPPPQQDLMLRVVGGQTSPKDLAEATGLPIGTVMSRLARARARLRADCDGAP